MRRIALTRSVPPTIISCELTHLARVPIDADRATAQHREYEDCLADLGCTVERLSPTPDLADSVFVEDTAVVLQEVAIITRPGAVSRRAEIESVAEALRRYRTLEFIQPPATLDGGDVLRLGYRLYVGNSARSNSEGISQLREIVSPYGYSVHSVNVTGCLHLKSAVTEVADNTVLLNPAWVDIDFFRSADRIEVHDDEPHAANALRIGAAVIYPANFPRTCSRLEQHGIGVHTIEVAELQKAEAGVTCCSILIDVS